MKKLLRRVLCKLGLHGLEYNGYGKYVSDKYKIAGIADEYRCKYCNHTHRVSRN